MAPRDRNEDRRAEHALRRIKFAVETAEDALRREPDMVATLLSSGLEGALGELAGCKRLP